MRFHGQRTNKSLAELLKASIETVAAREKAALLMDVADRSTDIARAQTHLAAQLRNSITT
jgi:hypothetical protein